MPAPSPSTKPSRSLSQGRLAACQVESLRVDNARGRGEAAHTLIHLMLFQRHRQALHLHHRIAIIRAAMANTVCRPVVHAVVIAKLGPFKTFVN